MSDIDFPLFPLARHHEALSQFAAGDIVRYAYPYVYTKKYIGSLAADPRLFFMVDPHHPDRFVPRAEITVTIGGDEDTYYAPFVYTSSGNVSVSREYIEKLS